MTMATAFDNTYVPGTRYIFDLFTSRMAGQFSFTSDRQVDYENFPMLEQPILVWVPDTHPYATKLHSRLDDNADILAAVKVTVNEVPKPLKPYNNPQKPVIFWNWPDSTPTSFSALVLHCSPLILPQITSRNYGITGRGYLLDEAWHPAMASDTSNYLGLLGPHFFESDLSNMPVAYLAPNVGPLLVGSNFVQYRESGLTPIAAQYLEYCAVPYTHDMGEAAPTIGYWMAFLPVSFDQAMFEACVGYGALPYEEDEEDEGEE